jgi:hypothetical protein
MKGLTLKRADLVAGCVLIVLSLLAFIRAVEAATFCVSTASEFETALATAANNGEDDIVQVVQGNYTGNFVYASTEAFNISIEGGYTATCASRVVDASNTVLDGSNNETVLVLSSDQIANFTVDGITLKNGTAQTIDTSGGTSGGGLNVLTNGSLTLTNSTVRGSSASNGGGVCVGPNYSAYKITVTLSNNIISNNSAYYGGGICAHGSGTITLSNNIIINNSTESNNSGGGGGVYLYGYYSGCKIILTNNTIKNNIANNCTGFATGDVSVSGGGVYVESDEIILNNNTISDNIAWAGSGGVGAAASESITLNNNVISNNSANSGGGGGVYLYGSGRMSTVTLTNNTFTDNTADNDGGGLMLGLREETAVADIYNNIIWNNSATASADIYINNDGDGDFLPATVNLFYNNFDQGSGGFAIVLPISIDPSNINNVDPLFIDAAHEAYYLQPGSQVVNAGTNSAPGLPATDKDSNPRIVDVTVDLGAYEYPGSVAEIAVVPAFHYFDDVETGSSATRDTHVYNTGGANLSIGNIAQANSLAEPFSIANDDCSGQVLTPASSCTVRVHFTPTASGFYNDSFDLPSSDSDENSVTVDVQGIGVSTSGDGGDGGGGGGGGCFISAGTNILGR